MAVNFKSSNLKDTEYATYNLSSFNGVDYTDTPTKVDDTRAIDISNYLPDGNTLYKRNGWEKKNYPFTVGYKIANIFRFKDKYVFLGRMRSDATSCALFIADDLEYTNGYQLDGGATFVIYAMAENYNGWAFEKDDNLFVFTGINYLRIYYTTITSTVAGHTTTVSKYIAKPVSNYAYVPTIAIGVQDNNSTAQSSSTYEEINMLSNYANIEFWLDFSNGEWTPRNDGYTWSKQGYFDLSNYFANYDNLQLSQIGGANLYQLEQTGWYGVGLLKENGERSDKIALFKLDGKKLLYRVYGVASTTVSTVNEPETNINNVSFHLKDYPTQEYQGNKSLKIKFQFDNSNATNTINHMRFGILYGADKNKDTLFVSGNPDYKNLDIHTTTPKDTSQEDWVTYTYFGDMSYHKIGSSSSAIIGYGINNDSSLMIIKQYLNNEPNVFIRTATYKTEEKTIELTNGKPFKYNDAYVLYQVFPSAININCDSSEQIIQYDNKVLVNAKNGIYYINVNSTTAESSYEDIEASYFIRNDLGEDISDSCFACYKNKLYVARKDKAGIKRVYVCDKNRYSFHNSKLIYEWWVLDNIPAERMFVFNEELIFIKDGYLHLFTSNYYDLDNYNFTSISVGDNSSSFVTDLFFDYDRNEMIITPTNEFIVACKTANLPKEAYQNFRDKTTVQLGNTIYWVLDNYLDLDDTTGFMMKSDIARNEIINTIIKFLEENEYKFYKNGVEYQATNNWEYYFDDDKLMGIKFNDTPIATENTINVSENATYIIPISNETKFSLSGLNNGEYDIEKCVYKEATWTYIDEGAYDELGQNVIFNHFKLAYNGVEIDFALDNSFISVAKLEFRNPVRSYWLSGYTALGRLDYLKTATNIYFVPDAIKGGYTNVGYRTYKKDVGYFTNAKGSEFSFNDIDFDDFSFGQTQFGRTYSSKKKIKNFSFIQMKFYSYDEINSTLATCTFRYKYSKNNKGVK